VSECPSPARDRDSVLDRWASAYRAHVATGSERSSRLSGDLLTLSSRLLGDYEETSEASSAPAASPETKMSRYMSQSLLPHRVRDEGEVVGKEGAVRGRESWSSFPSWPYSPSPTRGNDELSLSIPWGVVESRSTLFRNTPEATPRGDLRPTSGKSAAYPCEPMNSVVDCEPKSKSTLDQRVIAGVVDGEKYVPCVRGRDWRWRCAAKNHTTKGRVDDCG
jgi:hypothetical protein